MLTASSHDAQRWAMAISETEEEAKDRERYGDLAERLAAAWISHQQGLASVDYALKKYVRGQDEDIGQGWIQIAKQVSRTMTESLASALAPLRPDEN
jgi:hypothetical protein